MAKRPGLLVTCLLFFSRVFYSVSSSRVMCVVQVIGWIDEWMVGGYRRVLACCVSLIVVVEGHDNQTIENVVDTASPRYSYADTNHTTRLYPWPCLDPPMACLDVLSYCLTKTYKAFLGVLKHRTFDISLAYP